MYHSYGPVIERLVTGCSRQDMEDGLVYTPTPMCTSDVTLSADLVALAERLAESTHDNWAADRISQGWTYGPQRDDLGKTHPDLVPYSELSESEKEYDRKLVIETLKAILASGYLIEKA